MKTLLLLGLLLSSFPTYGGILKKRLSLASSERPATLILPRQYQADKPVPLVLGLHGLGSSPIVVDQLFGLSRNQNKLGYALILAQALPRPSDNKAAWNATPECCREEAPVDDSGYLQGLVKEAISKASIDPDKIYIAGHSNGGFMAYRLACDTNGMFKGIVSLAGAGFGDPSLCKTETSINVLQIHGKDDSVVYYDARGKYYPPAETLVERWADRNDCQDFSYEEKSQNLLFLTIEPVYDDNDQLRLDGNLFKFSREPETDSLTYSRCRDESRVALWRVNGADHAPLFFGRNVIGKSLDFLGLEGSK